MFKPHALVTLLWLVAAPLCAADPQPVAGLVSGIKVLPDKAPDCTSLKTIVESVTRGCQTNDEKAIAVYNFMRLTHYHRAYPSEPGGIRLAMAAACFASEVRFGPYIAPNSGRSSSARRSRVSAAL